jgi:hypothetical protein
MHYYNYTQIYVGFLSLGIKLAKHEGKMGGFRDMVFYAAREINPAELFIIKYGAWDAL